MEAPVTEVIGERMWLTVIVSVAALILTWVLWPFPSASYSAVRQYSVGDYVATFVGFIGLAVPNSCSPGRSLFRVHAVQRPHRRALHSGASRRPVEPGQGLDLAKHLPIRPDPGAGGNGAADPDMRANCSTSCASRTW